MNRGEGALFLKCMKDEVDDSGDKLITLLPW